MGATALLLVNSRASRAESDLEEGTAILEEGGISIRLERLDDGLLAVFAIEAQTFWGVVRLLPRLRSGQLRSAEGARVWRAESLAIETSRPLRITADGELVARTPARFGLVPRALRVFADSGEAPGG